MADPGHRSMEQVWITGPEQVEVRRVPVPVPAAGEVLVATGYAGICGSDLHTLRRGHPWLPYPIPPGHEAAGTVAALPAAGAGSSAAGGSSATGATGTLLGVGDPVYLRPAIACGNCFYCARSRPNLCAGLIGVGSHRPGAFAGYFTVPAVALAPVPAGVSLATAAMIEPLATAIHAVAVAAGPPGDLAGATVAVLGGGTIGQCVLLAVRAAGAHDVVLTDPVRSKRDLAVATGAVAAFDPADPRTEAEIAGRLSGRPDLVVDCVASTASLRVAVRLATRGGTVVVVGAGHGPLDVTIETIQDDEVRIAGSAMYLPADFAAAERLVAAGAPVRRLVTSVRPIRDAAAALRAAATGAEIKIQLAGPAGRRGASWRP
ncbi:zinc-dependent alcohol dehydrogenase [Solwaraspora sp. WMMB335]|uniref:zinc-dependent alcohol dehydrogenase n=1 Tax=Solwaraspora sp. WMMB335 TaxID=3404118 RepID=UPI003B93027B